MLDLFHNLSHIGLLLLAIWAVRTDQKVRRLMRTQAREHRLDGRIAIIDKFYRSRGSDRQK